MKKRTLGQQMMAHGGVYALSRFVNNGIGFLLIPIYAYLIGDEGYGIISLMMTVGAAAGYIMLQGLPAAWYRLRFDQKTPAELKIFETTITWYLFGSIIIGIAVISLFGERLAPIITRDVPFFPLGLLTIITAGLLAFPDLYQRKLQAEQRSITFAAFTALRALLVPGAIIIFVVVLRQEVLGKMKADVISAAGLTIVALVLLRPGSPRLFSLQKLRRSLAYGWPVIPHHLAGLANDLIDRILINYFLGLGYTGVYSMGYKIASIGMMLAVAINQAFSPLFYSTMKQVEQFQKQKNTDQSDKALRSIARGALLMIVTISLCLLAVTACAREILLVVTPAEFDKSWTVIPLVAAGVLALTCYFPLGTAVMYNSRRVHLMPIISGLAAAINITANIYLIPRFGIIGAAWATLLSNIVMALVAWYLGQKSTFIPHPWKKWILVIFVCFLGLAGLWAADLIINNLFLRMAIKLPWAAACILFIIWTTNYKISDIRKFISPEKTIK
ncbi:oligosaccharide flippase family protein [Planctomycetota bacterium]